MGLLQKLGLKKIEWELLGVGIGHTSYLNGEHLQSIQMFWYYISDDGKLFSINGGVPFERVEDKVPPELFGADNRHKLLDWLKRTYTPEAVREETEEITYTVEYLWGGKFWEPYSDTISLKSHYEAVQSIARARINHNNHRKHRIVTTTITTSVENYE